VSLGTRASEAASIDGVWAYGRNSSVSELGRGHVIRNAEIEQRSKEVCTYTTVEISTVEVGYYQCMIQ